MTEIVAVTSGTERVNASIRLELRRSGKPIPENDIWIAALARQHTLVVLSNDRHSDFVDDLARIAF